MDNLKFKQYEKLGPFEIKNFLAEVASKSAQESSGSYLNAGRGNPNWVATNRARRSSCSDSSRSPRASECSTCRPAWAACRRQRALQGGLKPG